MEPHQLTHRVKKMLEAIASCRYRTEVDIPGILLDGEPFSNGGEWAVGAGEHWATFTFRVTVPDDFTGRPTLIFYRLQKEVPQFLVSVNGVLDQALDRGRHTLALSEKAVPGETFDISIEAYSVTARDERPCLRIMLADEMEEVSGLWYDINVPYESLQFLPEGCRERETTLYTLSDALNLLDLRQPFSDAFFSSVADARAFMKTEYYDKLPEQGEAVADCIGHSHIDVAWKWDLEQTRHKTLRTFSTMLKLMERYPEFRFMTSQPQLLQFVKEDSPELYARIKEAIEAGKWEPEGGMWVEADCNISSGEALVRQFLYGNEFYDDEFGLPSKILWLPDVFGYSAALPQIIKKSGMDYFMTSKLSWSEFNCYPYDTFMWKGIDGTEVLTHFTPSTDYNAGTARPATPHFTTYNSVLSPNHIKGGWRRFQQKGVDDHFLVCFGDGDGGGGVTEEMLENARRMQRSVAGSPTVRQIFPTEFFAELEKRVAGNKRLPKWSGELYLEYHRGTYTAQGKNKRFNRKAELALRDLEYLLTRAENEKGMPYPQDELRELWRTVLLLQFHDILPGSSIHKVYEDSDKLYADVFARIDVLKRAAEAALYADARGDICLINTLSAARDDVVRFEGPEGVCALIAADGTRYPVQRYGDAYIAYVKGLPAFSDTSFRFAFGPEDVPKVKADRDGFETPFFKGTFDSAMRITGLWDKDEDRQLVRPGMPLNDIVYYENRPHNYDAWDVNIYYDERSWPVDDVKSVELVSNGPVAAVLRVTRAVSESVITQDILFYHDIKRIDFVSDIDWKEKHSLLKAHFPVDVFATQAQFDIQYGNVTRAIHRNTSWDCARFEVCAHKWADMSEAEYGTAILTDCKYGYSADENGLALSLLKSSVFPDETADQCRHLFSYAFMPHSGSWREADVPGEAYRFNIPVLAVPGTGKEPEESVSLVSVDKPNIVIESVKKALHGEGTIIRLYEDYGARENTVLTFARAPKKVLLTSMMEKDEADITPDGNELALTVKPYEIVTLRVIW